MKDENRKKIAGELAGLLGVETAIPESFEGIPVLNNQQSWFFRFAEKRGDGDIDALWNVFAAARRFVESDEADCRDEFVEAFDTAMKVRGVVWKLSIGLYWTHPWEFPTLDSQSRQYLAKRLGIQIPAGSAQGICDGEGYLTLIDNLKASFEEDSYPVHSFPELSLAAYQNRDPDVSDEELLAHFDGQPAFREFRTGWIPEERDLFCRLARAVYGAGLDWWHVGNGIQVRFGRKDPGRARATGVLGMVWGKLDRKIQLRREIGTIQPQGRQPLTEQLVWQIENQLSAAPHFPEEWQTKRGALWPNELENDPAELDPGTEREPLIEPYSLDQVLKDGCFLERSDVERLLERLRTRKNLILQGPPGTGKTWIAKRLAYALMGEKDDNRIRAVQFHPNLSYEDFVRGWRPTGEGRLAIADGVFLEAVRDASTSPSSAFVVVIEEINRGNAAQIFGEMLTLLEAGKRTPNEALELSYPDADGNRQRVHIPENLYVIGTMNIADRSLALVDLAFRRRFAFVTLEPVLGTRWRDWVVEERGVDPDLVREIVRRITELNATIAESLGKQFRIGHSYVTPTTRLEEGSTRAWFTQVAETEIGPQLEEYWFNSLKNAKDALERLLDGW